ncbi:hypothetical protein D3C73_986830 [compost metagenome]
MLAETFLRDIGEEGGNFRATGGQSAERETKCCAAQPGLPGAGPVLLAHPRTAHGNDVQGSPAQVGGNPEGFTYGEDRNGNHHNVQAVHQQRLAEGQATLAGHGVDAHQSDGQAQGQRGETP